MSDGEPLAAIAAALEADGASLWRSPAAAVVAAAAQLARADGDGGNRRAERHRHGRPQVVVQRGQALTVWGEPVLELVRLAGLRAREVGAVDACGDEELRRALGGAAGLLHVGVDRPGLVPLAQALWAAREAQVPVAVIDRDGEAWAGALDGGARLVVLDAAAFGGPQAGVILGEAAASGGDGFGSSTLARLLRAGPEQVIATRQAATAWERRRTAAPQPAEHP